MELAQDWSSHWSHQWASSHRNWSSLHHRIETVDGIGGVEDGAQWTIGIDHRVGALDHISIPHLLLALAVPGKGILHIIGERVLRMWIHLRVEGHSHWNSSWEQGALDGGDQSAADEGDLWVK